MRSEKRGIWRIAFILASLFSLLASRNAKAQFLGYTSPQSVFETVFTNVTGPTISPVFTTWGQSTHYVSYVTSGTVVALSLQIEGSPDGTHWFIVSETATDPLQGGTYSTAYLPFMRANLTAFSGSGISLTGVHSGTYVAPDRPTGAYGAGTYRQKILVAGAPANTTATFTAMIPKSLDIAGTIYATYSAPLSGGTLTITAGPDASHQTTVVASVPLASSSATQAIAVPPGVGGVVTVTYNSPGATPVTVTVTYGVTTTSPTVPKLAATETAKRVTNQ